MADGRGDGAEGLVGGPGSGSATEAPDQIPPLEVRSDPNRRCRIQGTVSLAAGAADSRGAHHHQAGKAGGEVDPLSAESVLSDREFAGAHPDSWRHPDHRSLLRKAIGNSSSSPRKAVERSGSIRPLRSLTTRALRSSYHRADGGQTAFLPDGVDQGARVGQTLIIEGEAGRHVDCDRYWRRCPSWRASRRS
jgi:hypothetical protein